MTSSNGHEDRVNVDSYHPLAPRPGDCLGLSGCKGESGRRGTTHGTRPTNRNGSGTEDRRTSGHDTIPREEPFSSRPYTSGRPVGTNVLRVRSGLWVVLEGCLHAFSSSPPGGSWRWDDCRTDIVPSLRSPVLGTSHPVSRADTEQYPGRSRRPPPSCPPDLNRSLEVLVT